MKKQLKQLSSWAAKKLSNCVIACNDTQSHNRGIMTTMRLRNKSAMTRKGFAFTLAEVLITLAIIGVVAALTIPTLVTKYKKTQTVTQLKKAYTNLFQAVQLSEVDNGFIQTWNFELNSEDFYNTYMKKYLKVVEEIPFEEYNKDVKFKYLNGRECSGESWCVPDDRGSSLYLAFADGTTGTFETYYDANSTSKNFIIDVNGKKLPNTAGKDIFIFRIDSSRSLKVSPQGYYKFDDVGLDRNALMGLKGGTSTSIISSCNSKDYGLYCSALIMLDGWQIKDDYPW